ncbi:hypothetical protein [Treponema sp.]|uniref:hypothetical protein n=1 Tax=Treponema sp. TaxID=166 RepID=UPI00298E5C47|nr:hypothetical protein [Treponema sp.]
MIILSFATAKKANKNSPVILDWQYKDEGEEIPAWVTAIAQSDKNTVVRELELEEYKVWTSCVSGENLEMLETFDDVAEVTEEISREMTIQVNEILDSNNTVAEKTAVMVQEVISEIEIRGLQKISSFWIKNGVAKKGVKKAKKESDYQVKFNYYSVWVMDKDLYEIQLKKIIERF